MLNGLLEQLLDDETMQSPQIMLQGQAQYLIAFSVILTSTIKLVIGSDT